MKQKRKSLSAVIRIARLIGKTEPFYFLWTLPQILVNAVLKLLYVYAPKLIIDRLTDGSPYRTVAGTVLAYAICLLILNVFLKLARGKSSFCAGEFARKLKFEVGKTVMGLSLSETEDKTSRETVSLAGHAASLAETMSVAEGMISNIIAVIGLGTILIRLDAVLLVSVLLVLSLKILFTYLRFRYDKKEQILRNENQLVGAYLDELAYFTPGAEKELRVNGLSDWFIHKVKRYRHDMLVWQYRDFRRYALFECLIAIAAALQSLVVLLILSNRYMGGSLAIADFTMFFFAVLTLGSTLSAFTEQIGTIEKQVLNFSHLERLFDLKNQRADQACDDAPTTDIGQNPDIVFDNVSFSYGKDAEKVLDHVNLTIRNGEKLVIVGMNGAGKTTLVKLLCKFYRPTSGRILVGGQDIESIPNDKYHQLIAAVFQDHSEFAFTLAENIALSENSDRDKIHQILDELELARFTGRLPEGLDTYMSRSFSERGIDPSGGEAQKLAIARAMYKDAPILILDEPTASLDAIAESEIYAQFFRLSAKKTTIFISHRLAASTVADRIVVLEKGRLVEIGSHMELMQSDGLYAKMYRRQSEPYIGRVF